MLIISSDIDVGNRKLGVINGGKNDANVSRHMSEYRIGEIEEIAAPLYVEAFDHYEVPATFAVRGQVIEANSSILELLRKSSVEHDVGAHGYYHKEFTKLSPSEAENELNLVSVGMKKFRILPKSFIFPRNKVAYLDLLEKYGYKCYRSQGGFLKDRMCIERHERLFNIRPSLYLHQSISSIFLRKMVDIAVAKKLPCHVWFHLWDFGENGTSIRRNIQKVLFPLLDYAKKKEKKGCLTLETMLSATEKVEKNGL